MKNDMLDCTHVRKFVNQKSLVCSAPVSDQKKNLNNHSLSVATSQTNLSVEVGLWASVHFAESWEGVIL